MKAIDTEYGGCWFRSRLEARWAVFFDAVGEHWDYEKQGYDLDDGDKYLPDFWLPRLNCFVEIKGQPPTDDEMRKCRKLQYFTSSNVVLMHGQPMENIGTWFCWDSGESGGGMGEWQMQWGLEDGRLMFLLCNLAALNHVFYIKEWEIFADTSVDPALRDGLQFAASQARRARFEHGETPSRPYPNIVDYDKIAF